VSDINDPLQLDALAAILLDDRAALSEQKFACDAFYASCLSQLGELNPDALMLPSGKAISSADAARCVLDFVRTTQFVRAMDRAISERLRRAPDCNVDIVYAGCGPIAPLALILARRYRRSGVGFHLIDIHPFALAGAQRLFELAGVAGILRRRWCCDAATTCLPADCVPDILVSETMQSALAVEPQLAILANLVPQCPADVVLVPERITISACLARTENELSTERASERIDLGNLIELSKATLPSFSALLDRQPEHLPEICLHVPDDAPEGMNLMLCTRVETVPGLVLFDYQSGLTYPQLRFELGAIIPGESLLFSYRLGREPGFRINRPANPPDSASSSLAGAAERDRTSDRSKPNATAATGRESSPGL
jgi:hypothetical protein